MTTRRARHAMPDFMRDALHEAGLTAAYEARPDYQRNDYISWITNAVREETRRKRLAQMLDELRAGDVYMRMPWKQGAAPKRAPTAKPGPASVDAYLDGVEDEGQRAALQVLRAQIQAIAPEATEYISYGIPTFKYRSRPLVGFTANKNACSFHTMSRDVKGVFAPDLDGYSTTKEAVHFKPGSPIPQALVERIVRARMAERDGAPL